MDTLANFVNNTTQFNIYRIFETIIVITCIVLWTMGKLKAASIVRTLTLILLVIVCMGVLGESKMPSGFTLFTIFLMIAFVITAVIILWHWLRHWDLPTPFKHFKLFANIFFGIIVFGEIVILGFVYSAPNKTELEDTPNKKQMVVVDVDCKFSIKIHNKWTDYQDQFQTERQWDKTIQEIIKPYLDTVRRDEILPSQDIEQYHLKIQVQAERRDMAARGIKLKNHEWDESDTLQQLITKNQGVFADKTINQIGIKILWDSYPARTFKDKKRAEFSAILDSPSKKPPEKSPPPVDLSEVTGDSPDESPKRKKLTLTHKLIKPRDGDA